MLPRVLVAGGLREPGPWDGYARAAGERLALAGVALDLLSASGFGRAMAEGHRKAAPAEAPAGFLRVHAVGEVPESLAAHVLEPLPREVAGDALAQALRSVDVVLVAGNGGGLADLLDDALRRGIPVVPLPIPQTTSEDLWERNAGRSFARVAVPPDVRQAYLSLRRPDPRSARSSEALATLLAGLASADELAGGPRVLLVESAAGDAVRVVLRRALRAAAPGARVEIAPAGWLRSPGRAFADAVRSADAVVVDLAGPPAALYAVGLARGFGRPVVPLAGGGAAPGVDPQALGAVRYDDERELAAGLERRLRGLAPASPRAKAGKPKRKRARRPRGTGARPKDAPAADEGER